MRQKFKRVLSLAIACVMLLTMLPVGVLAAEDASADVQNEKAGYFVLLPGKEKTDKAKSSYFPYDEETTVNKGKVDKTTGYIGYITPEAAQAVNDEKPSADGYKRLEISSDDYEKYLDVPKDYGQLLKNLEEKYPEQFDTVTDVNRLDIEWYEINNSELSSQWPNIAAEKPEGGRDTGDGYHVDGYIKGIKIEVVYYDTDPANEAAAETVTYRDDQEGTLVSGASYTVLDNTNDNINFTKEGYKFKGWNTEPDGTGTTYEAGTEIKTLMDSLVLYAQWEKDKEPDPEPTPDPVEPKWEVSRSKTATNLENYESKVTLSLPAADYKPEIDVVFVIDDTHAGNVIFKDAAEKTLDELQSKENLNVNVGIVNFDAVARDWISVTSNGAYSGLVSIKDEDKLAAIKTALGTKLSYDSDGQQKKVGGTNLEWPIDMANEMLKAGKGTEKYMILFSDMYGYIYRDDLKIGETTYEDVPVSKRRDTWTEGSLSMGTKYSTWKEVYAHRNDQDNKTANGFFRDNKGNRTNWDDYWKIYSGVNPVPTNTISKDYQVGEGTFSGFEESSCRVYDRLLECLKTESVIIVNNDFGNEDSPNLKPIKNGMLADLTEKGITLIQKTTSSASEPFDEKTMADVFNGLKNELIQLVDAGSKVEDVIGSGTDEKGNAYNFDFVNNASAMKLTVGDATYTTTAATPDQDSNETARYTFTSEGVEATNNEEAPFVLHYYAKGENGQSDECFIWDINVPVTKEQTVQLTYTVKLMNPQSTPGTYGTYDRDGRNGYKGLYTNNSAILYPKDSNGKEGPEQEFAKPTVSYEVAAPTPMYRLTYVYNNGQKNKVTWHYYGDQVDVTKEVPTRAGYTFTGWYADEALTQPVQKVYMDRHKTVYAGWELAHPVLNKDDHVAYIIGYPNSTDVRPEGNITRAEVVTIFFRLLTDESRAQYWSQTNPFLDVPADAWYNNAISTLTNAGIITGDPEGTFRPDDSITRAEFVAIAARFDDVTKIKDTDTSFIDVLKDHWAIKYITYAQDNGWVNGYEDGSFKPDQPITRAEAMKITNRVLERAVEKDADLHEDMITWTDNTPDKWYYRDVQEATNSHDYRRTGVEVSDGTIQYAFEYEKWDKVVEAPNWAALEKTWSTANSLR